MKISIDIERITVLTDCSGADEVLLYLSGDTPYPIMGYPGLMDIKVQAGYGVEWATKTFPGFR